MNPIPLAITGTFIFASILLIVTGAWNNFIFKLLKSSKIFKNEILGDFIYAILVTLLGLLVLFLIIKYIDKKADIKKGAEKISTKNVFIELLE